LLHFLQALADLGWTEGRNLRFEYRWELAPTIPDSFETYAMELVGHSRLTVIVAGSGRSQWN